MNDDNMFNLFYLSKDGIPGTVKGVSIEFYKTVYTGQEPDTASAAVRVAEMIQRILC